MNFAVVPKSVVVALEWVRVSFTRLKLTGKGGSVSVDVDIVSVTVPAYRERLLTPFMWACIGPDVSIAMFASTYS